MLEIHRTISHRLQSWAFAVAVVAAVLGVYIVARIYEDNIALRAEIDAMKARGCPSRLQGQPFAGNHYQEIDLMRPRFSKLSCYYSKGVKS
ncbi:MAG: hypothetical protein NUV51_10940 [Sulfuricaulis sp.]|nr:hypothetical protein [Sulfuricaulis sp.]